MMERFYVDDYIILEDLLHARYPNKSVFVDIHESIFNLRREAEKIKGEKDFFQLDESLCGSTFFTKVHAIPYSIIVCSELTGKEGYLIRVCLAFRFKKLT
jgi:hypothetical protein